MLLVDDVGVGVVDTTVVVVVVVDDTDVDAVYVAVVIVVQHCLFVISQYRIRLLPNVGQGHGEILQICHEQQKHCLFCFAGPICSPSRST